jgi:pentapeptide MXKDX repeat protein
MNIRKPITVAVVAALSLAACGGDDDGAADTVPAAAEESMAEESMAEESMAEDSMAEDSMADDSMADDSMADDSMADDSMADDSMAEDSMADDMAEDSMADDSMADDMADDSGVVSVIAGRDDLSVLVTAIQAAGLGEALHGDGPFTIFAPTDAAFEAYLGDMGMTAEDVLADTAGLTALLQAHVVAGNDDSAMVMSMAGQSFTTLAGTPLAVTVDGDTTMVGNATIVEYDLTASNGTVHVIDTVLAPAG